MLFRSILQAVDEADAVVFLVDGRTGLTPQDKIIADRLRQSPTVFSYSLEEQVEQIIPFTHSELSWWIYLRQGLWFVHYDEDSKYKTIVNVFSIDGELKQTITNVNNSFYTARAGRWLYLINERQLRYDLSTHECQDLGEFPLKGVFFHDSSYRDLHFFTCEGQSQLVAMRDKDSQGLKEVYRLDFAESDRCKPSYSRNVEPGQVYFINFYDSDLWVSTYERVYRIDITTGQKLGTLENQFLPKMSHHGGIGYAIYAGFYTVMDFKNRQLLCCRLLDELQRDRKSVV